MKLTIFNMLLFIFLVFLPGYGMETRVIKSLERDFDVPEKVNLELTNKYGNIVIGTWDQPVITIRIEITAYGKDTEDAEKLLKKVEFDFHQTKDHLVVESVFDRRSGFFKDLLNSLSDYSKTIISNNKLKVDYDIMIPEKTASITLDNKFGDVFIGNINARTRFVLGHGNFVAEKLGGYCELDLSYGKAKVKYLDECRLSMKATEFYCDEAARIDLQSSNSKLYCGEVHSLSGSSTNDLLQVGALVHADLDADFTEIKLDVLSGKSRINQHYGQLHILHLTKDFLDLHLEGQSTDYNILISDLAGFETIIKAREDQLQLGKMNGKLQKEYLDDRSKIVRLTGHLGKPDLKANLYLDASSGEVSLDFVRIKPPGYNN